MVQINQGLKPCPFCGGRAHVLTGMVEFIDVEITCTICAATGGNENAASTVESNRLAAIAAWNRRTPSTNPQDER